MKITTETDIMKNQSLTIITPQLLPGDTRKKYPFIARYFQRAIKTSLPITEQLPKLLCHLFDLHCDKIPIAALTALADHLPAQSGWWLRMDPAELHADHANVFFVGISDNNTYDQNTINTLKSFLATDGFTLHTPHPHRWYLQCDSDPKIQTIAPNDVLNQPLFNCLPTGEREKYWRQLFTEIQLLLHPQKTARMNSVWFWGEGQLPESPLTQHWDQVKSTERLGLGLAQLAKIPCEEISENDWQQGWSLSSTEKTLVILDVENTDETMTILDTRWFQPILSALKKNELSSVDLYIGDGHCYTLTPKQLSFFFHLSPVVPREGAGSRRIFPIAAKFSTIKKLFNSLFSNRNQSRN